MCNVQTSNISGLTYIEAGFEDNGNQLYTSLVQILPISAIQNMWWSLVRHVVLKH